MRAHRSNDAQHRVAWSDILWAWLVATVLSGIPSTLYLLVTGRDVLAPTRAAAAMLTAPAAPLPQLIAAAALVHSAVSFFWVLVLAVTLPARHTVWWALAASAAIALVDLRVIAPAFFPEVAALAFWPQFADHLMWGACVGLTLEVRRKRRQAHIFHRAAHRR